MPDSSAMTPVTCIKRSCAAICAYVPAGGAIQLHGVRCGQCETVFNWPRTPATRRDRRARRDEVTTVLAAVEVSGEVITGVIKRKKKPTPPQT